MSSSLFQILFNRVPVRQCRIGQISYIRINPQKRTVYLVNIVHRFLRCIHKLRFHGFKAEKNPSFRCHSRGSPQVLAKSPDCFFTALLIVNIISRELNDAYPQIIRKTDRFLHHLHASFPRPHVTGPKRIFSVSGQAHTPYR